MLIEPHATIRERPDRAAERRTRGPSHRFPQLRDQDPPTRAVERRLELHWLDPAWPLSAQISP
jgi:hypothetical protein